VRTRSKQLSLREAQRAIYIDFEGLKDQAPALLGVLVDNRLRQHVFDPVLQKMNPGASARLRIDGVLTSGRSGRLARTIGKLAARCEREGRRICAFSDHDLKVIQRYVGTDVATVYVNARLVARRWINACHPDARPSSQRLRDYLALRVVRYHHPVPSGQAAKWIRQVKRTVGRLHASLAANARAAERWRMLLEYNAHDCIGLRHLTLLAARDYQEKRHSSVATTPKGALLGERRTGDVDGGRARNKPKERCGK
jgi:hypothetical protein